MRVKTIMKPAMVVALAAVVLFALGLPAALATTGRNGPSVPVVGDDVTSYAEVQIVSISAATGGTFTLTCSAGTTAPIAFNATGTDVRNALLLAACPNVASVAARTVATSDKGGPWKVMWRSSGGNIAPLSGSGAALVPAGSVTVTPVQDGLASVTPAQVDPHGGYSSTTDYCLQCHQVHNAPNAYSLLAATSVSNVCATCHALFGSLTPTGTRIIPGLSTGLPFPGTTPGTTSLRSAYDNAAPVSDHAIPGGAIPDSTVSTLTESGWSYGGFSVNPTNGANTVWKSDEPAGPGTASPTGGGLYCGSCHTPHGEFGQAVNTRWYRADVGLNSDGTITPYVINEVQTVAAVGTSGTWTLTYVFPDDTASVPHRNKSATLAWGASLALVQAQLDAIVGAGNTTATGSGTSADPFVVTFTGGLAGINQNQLVGAVTAGGSGVVAVATSKNGDTFNGTHENVHSFQEGSPAFVGGGSAGGAQAYLHLDDSPVVWESCPLDPTSAGYALTKVGSAVDTVVNTANPGPPALSCSYLTASDSEGQTVYLYGYKLLSAYPNHSWAQGPESWGMSNHSHDVARWCGRCHNATVDSSIDATSTFHSHPTGCTSCHGNPNDMTSFDFPHTSTFAKLLKDYPDALCINCHTAGSLP